jgi:hypothetical protein
MKTKNQTGHTKLESPEKAANDDSFPNQTARENSAPARQQAWSPKEVWRTRVKPSLDRSETLSR